MRPRSLSALASHAVKAAPAGGLAPGLDLFDHSGVWEPRRWLRGESSPPDALRAGSQKSEMRIVLIPALGQPKGKKKSAKRPAAVKAWSESVRGAYKLLSEGHLRFQGKYSPLWFSGENLWASVPLDRLKAKALLKLEASQPPKAL